MVVDDDGLDLVGEGDGHRREDEEAAQEEMDLAGEGARTKERA